MTSDCDLTETHKPAERTNICHYSADEPEFGDAIVHEDIKSSRMTEYRMYRTVTTMPTHTPHVFDTQNDKKKISSINTNVERISFVDRGGF